MTRDNFVDRAARYQNSVIDVFRHAGINTLWLTPMAAVKGAATARLHRITPPQARRLCV